MGRDSIQASQLPIPVSGHELLKEGGELGGWGCPSHRHQGTPGWSGLKDQSERSQGGNHEAGLCILPLTAGPLAVPL